ncbi:hypothetical protein KRMM14A1004_21270 [Krasilnikovia sp. MM14-A1004]
MTTRTVTGTVPAYIHTPVATIVSTWRAYAVTQLGTSQTRSELEELFLPTVRTTAFLSGKERLLQQAAVIG